MLYLTDASTNIIFANYDYNGYAVMINSVKKYYSTSIELLKPEYLEVSYF